MSQLFTPIEITFNRKPSRAVIMRTIAEYLKQGAKCFTLSWGENCIELDYHPRQEQWYGTGWMKEIGGDDIAQELNQIRKQAVQQFVRDRFIFVHVK